VSSYEYKCADTSTVLECAPPSTGLSSVCHLLLHMCGDTVSRGADGIIVVYDITNQESFHHVDDWMREIQALNSLALLD
jgi:hypothetical protein